MDNESVKKNLVDELYWDGKVDASDINVDVKDTEVVLKGKVPTYRSKLAAETDAVRLSGARLVKNNVRVDGTRETPSDGKLETMVESKLMLNSDLMGHDINASATGGIVTLSGSVDAYWKKMVAQREAEDVFGVINVNNDIGIAPTEDIVDEEIAKDIMKSLDRNILVPSDNVNALVEDGEVTLTGHVPNWNAYEEARRAAENTLGVRKVTNSIKIKD